MKTCLFPLFLMAIAPVFAEPEWLIIGNDLKVECRAEGLTKVAPKGVDTVTLIDLSESEGIPEKMVNMEISNSIFGPPTNLAVTPDQKLAIVATSLNWLEIDGVWSSEPANLLHVVDLEGGSNSPVRVVQTKAQPSGISISRDGKSLLVANRADRSISLFRIDGKKVEMTDTVAIDGEAAAVAFHPSGKQALVTKFSEHLVAQIEISEGKLHYDPARDIPVGRSPYNVKFLPNGEMAIVCNTGNNGLPDGHIDTLSLIDYTGEAPHVCDTVSVGDGPEGLAVSADGRYVAVPLLNGGTDIFKGKWFHHEHGEVVLYEVVGKNLEERSRVETGSFPEGITFSHDGRRLFVANLDSEDLSVFAVEGGRLKLLGEPLKLPGKPGSMGTANP
ncbi:lactonase family protein [Haloferula chungangensis]|uniref:Lactonase family protein n=1 Tax=Haloferula chungangensis TaxID=1048331 RepID=A0ABW2L9H9_9BACT